MSSFPHKMFRGVGESHLLFIFLFFDEEGGRQCWAYTKTLLGVVPNRTHAVKEFTSFAWQTQRILSFLIAFNL